MASSTARCSSVTGPVARPCMEAKRANDVTPPRARSRATSTSGWTTTFTYAPTDTSGLTARAVSTAHFTRAGSAPTAAFTISAWAAATRITLGPVAATALGTLGCDEPTRHWVPWRPRPWGPWAATSPPAIGSGSQWAPGPAGGGGPG